MGAEDRLPQDFWVQLIHVGIQAGRGGGDERKSHFHSGEHLGLRHPEEHLWGQNLGAEGRGQAVGCRVICDPHRDQEEQRSEWGP